jgi:methionyl-tRNA formyltransferase
MRIAVLTTETLHHAHFVRELASRGHDVLALIETEGVVPPYETGHPFEAARDEHERAVWFGGRPGRVADFAESRTASDINGAEPVATLRGFTPDLAVCFGTRRLKADLIGASGDRLVNLHGGDPEKYRGLDTHLWAVWHRDFVGLQTCLHRVDDRLDTGEIVQCLPVQLAPGSGLHQLRQANTETCLRLTELAIAQIEAHGAVQSRPQKEEGRYYSFMPAALKEICVKRFAHHMKGQ